MHRFWTVLPNFNLLNMKKYGFIFLGVHPVSTLVYTLIGLVVNHKEVQKKVHKELHEVLGKRKPCLCDQSSLPYCRALITETMRYTSTAPLIMRKVITDVKLGGYDIAKETIVSALLNHFLKCKNFQFIVFFCSIFSNSKNRKMIDF